MSATSSSHLAWRAAALSVVLAQPPERASLSSMNLVELVVLVCLGIAIVLLIIRLRQAQRQLEAAAENARLKQTALKNEIAARHQAEGSRREQQEWLRVTLNSIG